MKRVGAAVTVLALAVGVAACGGSGGSGGPGASAAARSAAVRGGGPPLATYRATLSGRGTPPGAASGRGYAIIALHNGLRLCWRFAHLHGFTLATHAMIYGGGGARADRVGLSAGPRLHHQGCVAVSRAMTQSLSARPSGYSVVVYSARYPAGAVRGRL